MACYACRVSAVAPDSRYRWSRARYQRLVEAGVLTTRDRVELVRGDIVEMSPKGVGHAVATNLAAEALRTVFGPGITVSVQNPLALGTHDEPEPDVAVVRGAARDYRTGHPATAALVVEVSDSSLEYDRTVKAVLYARAAIPEYWIVNLVDGRLEVHRTPGPDGYASIERLDATRSVSPLAAPGATLPVADLLP